MKLSIVIPTYNAHEWIQGCLDSIQLHRPAPSHDYEIIVVDDRSSDDTVAIVREHVSRRAAVLERAERGVRQDRERRAEGRDRRLHRSS